jgi:hypothetical protein
MYWDACTHTGKTGAASDSGARCNVNKWVRSHAAGLAEWQVQQISVPDLNSTSWAPGRRLAYQFQCKCIGTCTRVWTCRCQMTVLNTSVCMKPIHGVNWPLAAVLPLTCEKLHNWSQIWLQQKAGVCAGALKVSKTLLGRIILDWNMQKFLMTMLMKL